MYDDDTGASPLPKILLCSFLALCAFGALAFVVLNKKPEPVAAPAKFVVYTPSDKAFAFAAPQGWARHSSASGGIMSSVGYEKSSAKVDVLSDLEGSLMADLSRGPGQMPDLPPGMMSPEMEAKMKEMNRPPVEKLHETRKGRVGDAVEHYQERPMQTLNTPLGEGRCSEWSGDAGRFGGGIMHGYRATVLSGDRRIIFVCRCRESDWKTLKPAFDKMLVSLAPGGG